MVKDYENQIEQIEEKIKAIKMQPKNMTNSMLSLIPGFNLF